MLNATASKYPYYNVMITMLPLGKSRPSIPDYTFIEQDIRQALQDVYNKVKQTEASVRRLSKEVCRISGMDEALVSVIMDDQNLQYYILNLVQT